MMSHYRKVDVKIWNDEKFVSLSVEGKLGFIMLLTHPMMTALGAMRGTPGGIVEELCCGDEGKREAFREGLRDVFRKGMAEADEKASLIVLPNFLKYNLPESPNVVKAWGKSAELIPEGPLKTLTIQRAVGFVEGMSKAFAEAIPIAFRNAMSKPSPKAIRNQRAESTEPGAEVQEGSGGEEQSPTHARVREAPRPPHPGTLVSADLSDEEERIYVQAYDRELDASNGSDFQAKRYAAEQLEKFRKSAAPGAVSIHPEPLSSTTALPPHPKFTPELLASRAVQRGAPR